MGALGKLDATELNADCSDGLASSHRTIATSQLQKAEFVVLRRDTRQEQPRTEVERDELYIIDICGCADVP